MPSLAFPPAVSRYQTKATADARFAVGDMLPAGVTKTSSRTPFESGTVPVVVHWASMEHILDHVFRELKVQGPAVAHGVAVTEAVGNPPYCRREMSELLFEGYGVPRVAYGIDALFAAAAHLPGAAGAPGPTALVVSVGHGATHILPVVRGTLLAGSVRRIKFGGAVAAEHLLRLLQLKFPAFPLRMSLEQAEQAFQRACMVHPTPDYAQAKLPQIEAALEEHDFVLQFPFVPTDAEAEAAKAKEREALAERRRQQAEKLRDKARAKREDKLRAKREQVAALEALQRSLEPKAPGPARRAADSDAEDDEDLAFSEDEDDRLAQHGFASAAELDGALAAAARELRAYENRLAGIEEPKEEPDYGLLDVPDEQLGAAELQEKRRQRLLKSGADARDRARALKEEARREAAQREAASEQKRLADFEGWRRELYQKRQDILARVRARQQQRDALANRKSVASGSRLKAVVGLGIDSDKPGQEDDQFGMDDADWQVYRDIRTQGQAAMDLVDEQDQEDEDEADQAALAALEEHLERWDDAFFAVLAAELQASRTVLDRLRSPRGDDGSDEAAAYQLHMNVERWRVPEALFEPSLIGCDSAGLAESIASVVGTLDPAVQAELMASVWVTGGTAAMPGLCERLHSELMAMRPAGETLRVRLMDDLRFGAWQGAAQLAQQDRLPWVTRAWYEEHGGHRMPSPPWFANPC